MSFEDAKNFEALAEEGCTERKIVDEDEKNGDDMVIDFIMGDYSDAVAGDVHPDEMDLVEDETELENEDQVRLREMLNDGEEEDLESEDSFEIENSRVMANNAASVKQDNEYGSRDSAGTWCWSWSHAKRLSSAATFLRGMSFAVSSLRIKAEDYVSEARRNRAEAGAHALKSASIIGATVVGAARRLEAIRAAEPFAVVVEEACEVMEPTLMAVLAVKSLRKLELIGDHRQLPAFIQSCWFNFETSLPSIKTSLFERLISGKVASIQRGRHSNQDLAHPVPSTILDEQRRMRSVIADLTRPDYADIVMIKDHPHTVLQRIGDQFMKYAHDEKEKDRLGRHRSLWQSHGRYVPGILPTIFFWNISGNKEGRPIAGLSACNPIEAEAVANLTKWLMVCGVPAASISIITPYKGQKMLIQKLLRQLKCLPAYGRDGPPARSTIVTVSTVDRYQGDENDVVILSLVRTQPGNRFVGLLNRFIVAVSRARMGFYIVGCVDAVTKSKQGQKGPSHWNRLISHLKTTAHSVQKIHSESIYGENEEVVSNDPIQSNRFENNENPEVEFEDFFLFKSAATPSSPVLPESTALVEATAPRKAVAAEDYSEEKVSDTLPVCCPRHRKTSRHIKSISEFPSPDDWNEFCAEPCDYLLPGCKHVCQLPCHSPVRVPHTSKCMIEVERPCFEHRNSPLKCHELNVNTYGTLDKALEHFKCEFKVVHRRPECDHTILLPCHEKKEVDSGKKLLPKCDEIVSDFINPGCNHVIKSPTCYHRRMYETNPPKCNDTVSHRRPCGCVVTLQCSDASAERKDPILCNAGVERCRPRCQHKYSVRCHVATELQALWDKEDGMCAVLRVGNKDDQRNILVEHGVHYGPAENTLIRSLGECSVPVSFKGECGHIFSDIPCSQAFQYAAGKQVPPLCTHLMKFESKLCGHVVSAPCWFVMSLADWAPWGAAGLPAMNSADQLLIPEELLCPPVTPLPGNASKELRKMCPKFACVMRSCGPGHQTLVPCSQIYPLMTKKEKLKRCEILVDRLLQCQHISRVECHTKEGAPPICRAAVDDMYTFSCGIHSICAGSCERLTRMRAESPRCTRLVSCVRFRCGHNVQVPCHQQEALTSYSPGARLTMESSSAEEMPNRPLVRASELYCSEPADVPQCLNLVTFERLCGHRTEGIACTLAFQWASTGAPNCEIMIEIESPLCGHTISVPCWLIPEVTEWKPWGDAGVPDNDIVQSFDANGESVCVQIVNFNGPKPSARSPKIPKELLKCSGSANYVRECGHTCVMSCCDAYGEVKSLCTEPVSIECPEDYCKMSRIVECHKYEADKRKGNKARCTNKVEKICMTCEVGKKQVECYQFVRECKQEVTVALRCGHETSWRCGVDEDPRHQQGYVCKACLLPLWSEAVEISKNVDQDSINEFIRNSRELVQDTVGSLCEIIYREEVPLQNIIESHKRVRASIIKKNKEILAGSSKGSFSRYPPPAMGSNGDIENYGVVFTPIVNHDAKKNKNQKEKNIQKNDMNSGKNDVELVLKSLQAKKPTLYGSGIQVQDVSMNTLAECQPSSDGLISICVGVAFRFRSLTNTKPFRSTQENMNKKNTEKENKNANRLASEKINQGYDCVQTIANEEKDSMTYVYWEVGVIVPLYIFKVKLHMKCILCLDYFTSIDGYSCKNHHFICWEPCFEGYVNSAKEAGAIARSFDKEGNLRCPECDDLYDLKKVAESNRPQAFDLLVNLKSNLHAQKVLQEGIEVRQTSHGLEMQ